MNANNISTETSRPNKPTVKMPKRTRRTSRASIQCEGVRVKTPRKPDSELERRCQETPVAKPVTVVEAKIDVGLGNALFIRGQGNGLNWEKGQPLNCVDASKWIWESAPSKEKTVFKLLVNDAIWARGEDIVVEAGRKIQVEPGF